MMDGLEAKAEQAQTQAEQAMTGLRETLLALLAARTIPCSDDVRARVLECQDQAALQRWFAAGDDRRDRRRRLC
jgi:hypothetical protein